MANNKVVFGNEILMDLTEDTVDASKVLLNETFHDKSGTQRSGTLDPYVPTDSAETTIADDDYFPFYDTSASGKKKTLWSNIKSVLKTYFDTLYNKLVISPTPASGLTEAQIINIINSAIATNENVTSLFGIQKWSNTCNKRYIYSGTVNSTGIGTWKDKSELTNPTAADEASWGWWYNEGFKIPDNSDNIELKVKYDPSKSDTIALGGWTLDTTTGYLCIKFANEISDTSNAKIVVDLSYTRNQIN